MELYTAALSCHSNSPNLPMLAFKGYGIELHWVGGDWIGGERNVCCQIQRACSGCFLQGLSASQEGRRLERRRVVVDGDSKMRDIVTWCLSLWKWYLCYQVSTRWLWENHNSNSNLRVPQDHIWEHPNLTPYLRKHPRNQKLHFTLLWSRFTLPNVPIVAN